MRQFWLVNKVKKKISLYPYVTANQISFKIVGTGYETMPKGFDPEAGTVARAVATCPICGGVVDDDTTRRLFKDGKAGHRLVSVVTHQNGAQGKSYRIATEQDRKAYREAEIYLSEKEASLTAEWGIAPVPDEPLPPKETLGFRVQRYGMLKWGDLYNSRQKLMLITFAGKVRAAYQEMIRNSNERDYARAVTTYLAVQLDKIASSSNIICRWQPNGEKIADVFSRQALPMVWDYPEVNVLTGASRSFRELFKDVITNIEYQSLIRDASNVAQSSATSLPYLDNSFDAILTDPPYYDNVPYAFLSDFFYVWLKRTVDTKEGRNCGLF
jgi:adenine-specific DNA methylase